MVQDDAQDTTQDKILAELRRGVLLLAVLSQLREAQYGYSLKQLLSDKGMAINEGTLYPLLRRLEEQKLLVSDWKVIDDVRPRRYYKMSAEGQQMLATMTGEWHELVAVLNQLLSDAV